MVLSPKGSVISGFLLVLGIALVAFLAYPFIPGTNEVLLGLLFGVLWGNIWPIGEQFKPGVELVSKKGLDLAIIFLGFGISYQHIGSMGWGMLGLLAIMVLVMLVATFQLARLFKCRTSTGWLVGFGTVICGSSAIAALSGSITKDKEDVGVAIAVVNLLGLAGMLTLPLVSQFIPIDDRLMATLLGATLHAVGNVAGAGYSLSDTIGDLAITVKLGRVALLAPALILFNLMVNRKASIRENLQLPYYIWGFILAVSIVSIFPVPNFLLDGLKFGGKILLTLAMAAIGLRIGIRSLMQTGRIAIGFGVILFLFQILLVVILAKILL